MDWNFEELLDVLIEKGRCWPCRFQERVSKTEKMTVVQRKKNPLFRFEENLNKSLHSTSVLS